MNATSPSEPIAIIGMACRLPGNASRPEQFWGRISEGFDGIIEVPGDRWSRSRFYDPDPARPGRTYFERAGFLQQPIDGFDSEFFGLAPAEADRLDPIARMLMEMTWEAMDDAGVPAHRLSGPQTGVFVGGFMMDWSQMQFAPENAHLLNAYSIRTSGLYALPGRISYTFDFRGPSVAVDTACSASLVALDYACASLRAGHCRAAVVGAANVMLHPMNAITLAKGRLLSPRGRSHTFDASGDGYGRGEGGVVLLLRPLSDALANGDTIHAVIRGVAVTHDGRSPLGMGAPNPVAQEEALRRALEDACLGPRDLHYIETHGTGTAAGDPVEVSALANVVGAHREPQDPCFIGSLKPNIGHLEAAAGLAGFLKTVLAVRHGALPPQRAVGEWNSALGDLSQRGLKVPWSLTPWPASGVRRAAVNSFGYGGTVANVIIESAPEVKPQVPASPTPATRPPVYLLTAASAPALAETARALEPIVSELDASGLRDLAYTLSERRSRLPVRAAIQATDGASLRGALAALAAGTSHPSIERGSLPPGANVPRLAFVYTGMGPQRARMGMELFASEPTFAAAMRRCDEAFARIGDFSILAELSAPPETSRVGETLLAQTTNFAVQVALTELLRSFGVEPTLITGHSVGEVAAAWAAGALSFDDAVTVSYHRARLQATLAGRGAMMAAELSREEAQVLTASLPGVSVAAVNAPRSLTLAGSEEELRSLAQDLAGREIFHRWLTVEVPYHSPVMDEILPLLRAALRDIQPRLPDVPLFSTVTGARVDEAIHDAAYFCRNARDAVLFADAVRAMADADLFLEVGPHPVLRTSVGQCLAAGPERSVATLVRDVPESTALAKTMAQLVARGVDVSLTPYQGAGRLLSLPHYPWQRKHHWNESAEHLAWRTGGIDHPLAQRAVHGAMTSWEGSLARTLLPWLDEHVVQGEVVLPGSAYVEVACYAARAVTGAACVALRDLRFERALFLPTHDIATLRITVDPDSGSFVLASRSGAAPDAGFASHVRGRVERGELAAERAVRALPPALDGFTSRDREEIYRDLDERGFAYGNTFQQILRQWVRGSEAWSELEVPASRGIVAGDFLLHPASLDACFHALLAAQSHRLSLRCPYLPVGIDHLFVAGPLGDRFWVQTLVSHEDQRVVEGDIRAFDAEGRLVLEVRGFRAQALESASAEVEVSDSAWRLAWEPWQPASPAPLPRRALVLGESDLARNLRAALTATDAQDDDGEPNGPLDCFIVEDVRRPPEACIAAVQRLGEVFRGVVNQGRVPTFRLRLITRGAISVAGEVPDPGAYALWGWLRAAEMEHSDLATVKIDLPPGSLADDLKAILAVEPGLTRPERAVRNEAWYRATVVASTVDQLRVSPVRMPPDGRFSVTWATSGDLVLDPLPERASADEGCRVVHVLDATVAKNAAGEIVFREIVGTDGGTPVYVSGASAASSEIVAANPNVHPLPPGLDAADAAGAESYAVARVALASLRDTRLETLLVLADDAAGLPVAVAARDVAARVLLVTSPNAADLEIASWLEAAGVALIEADAWSLRDRLADHGVAGIDALVALAGGPPLNAALAKLRPAGQVVLLGAARADALDLKAFGDGVTLSLPAPRPAPGAVDAALADLACGRLPPLLLHRMEPTAPLSTASRWRAQRLSVDALRTPSFALRAGRAFDVRPAATYIVIGGTGGLGLATARWLAERGAQHLVLVSRRGLRGADARAQVSALREMGVVCRVACCDVADANAVASLFADVSASMPPIRGIVHAAFDAGERLMVFAHEEPAEAIDSRMRAKVLGAVALVEEVRRLPNVDFFLVYSSISSLFPSLGVSSYVAANHFLDAFAVALRAEGVHALSVSLGGVAGGGLLTREEALIENADRSGFVSLPAEAYLNALPSLLEGAEPHVGLARLTLARYTRAQAGADRMERFRELHQQQQESGAHEGFREELVRLADDTARLSVLVPRLIGTLATQLGVAAERVAPQQSIRALGLDSLSAVSVQVALQDEVGVSLPVIKLLQGPTVEELATLLLARIAGESHA